MRSLILSETVPSIVTRRYGALSLRTPVCARQGGCAPPGGPRFAPPLRYRARKTVGQCLSEGIRQ